MKRSKNFCQLVENINGNLFSNKFLIRPLGGNRISINDNDYGIKP